LYGVLEEGIGIPRVREVTVPKDCELEADIGGRNGDAIQTAASYFRRPAILIS
jgi:hypothetical protein